MTTAVCDREDQSLLQARKNVYLLLAKIFLGEFAELEEAARKVPIVLAGSELDLAELIQSLKQTPLRELYLQYDNLFVIPGGYFVPPFEHYYRFDMAGEEIDARIGHYYRSMGYYFPMERMERNDHIGCELAFMYFLITGEMHFIRQRNTHSAERIRTIQRQFLQDHLSQWVEPLAERVGQRLVKGFMREATSYLRQFVPRDMQQLV